MKFDVQEFKSFCKDMSIDTKEMGVVSLGEAWSGTQEYFIQEVAKGLEEGIHYFVVLKGRQVHISTVCLALDLYWAFKYEGMGGTLIADTEDNRDMFRITLTLYTESLPNKWKRPIRQHNRTQMIVGNRSRLSYQVVGTKKKEKRGVGVGKAIVMMHATEVANWGDDQAFADIEASLAESNPRRLFIWESTARGYNHFEDMWRTAQRAKSQRAIFIGWWRNHLYKKKKGSPEYNVYWDGVLTAFEKRWVDEVKALYDFDIDDEQMAWWRWKYAENIRDESKMFQEYPPTEEYAFQMSGSKFFLAGNLTDRMKLARVKPFDTYRFAFSDHFADTQLLDASPDFAQMKIWEPPKEGGYYAIGGDPAYGSSEWADRFCVQVYRCYADGMDQVAEYNTSEGDTTQFAWILLYLCGAYSSGGPHANVMLNLEINGPGINVWAEIQNMKRLVGTDVGLDARISNVLLNIQNYLYKRPDSLAGTWNYHWKTDLQTKERMMNSFKDGFERGIVVVNSTECIEEMKKIQREENGDIAAPGRSKDDRVIASGLCAVAWHDFLRLQLAARAITRASAKKGIQTPTSAMGRNVQGYLKAMGMPQLDDTVIH